jgi:hypothetical protein
MADRLIATFLPRSETGKERAAADLGSGFIASGRSEERKGAFGRGWPFGFFASLLVAGPLPSRRVGCAVRQKGHELFVGTEVCDLVLGHLVLAHSLRTRRSGRRGG